MDIKKLNSNKGTILDGIYLLKPKLFYDDRGSFYESWNKDKFNMLISSKVDFVQDNISYSSKGVLRGLHYQSMPKPQGKLIRCSYGKIFDVAVDIRKSSNTFGQWAGTTLTAENKNQLWIPMGFAHGFIALTEFAEVTYKTTGFWKKKYERSINWNDKFIGIEWPLEKYAIQKPILSKKDILAPTLNEAKESGEVFE